ncbi:MAG: hypothetical protein ACRDY7_07955 [Acidimicrobiia bacterium]
MGDAVAIIVGAVVVGVIAMRLLVDPTREGGGDTARREAPWRVAWRRRVAAFRRGAGILAVAIAVLAVVEFARWLFG